MSVEPAMTAGEWDSLNIKLGESVHIYKSDDHVELCDCANHDNPGGWYRMDRMQALAALCLFEQPFGFRRRDVKALRTAKSTIQKEVGNPLWLRFLDDLADRIEALLPPEEL